LRPATGLRRLLHSRGLPPALRGRAAAGLLKCT
jgi:hypothetical protein